MTSQQRDGTAPVVDDIPTAIPAEQAVLGAMLLAPSAVTDARKILTAADFYRSAHEIIYAAICDLADTGIQADPVTLLAELDKRAVTTKIGGAAYLHTLYAGVPTHVNCGHYALQVRSAARRRRLVETGQRLAQIGRETADLDDALMHAAREALSLTLLVDETDNAPITGLHTWTEFLNQPDRVADWVVPNLIERQDVLMILARPGVGKSWLSRQFALAIAAGVHPFRPDVRIPPQRTLLVDLENPPSMVRRQARPLATAVEKLITPTLDAATAAAGDQPAQPLTNDGNAWLWAQPGGLNIRDRKDAQLLERVIAETQPAFVALGSLYNAFERGRDDWDTAAEETKAVFNRMRSRYRCAFLIEHHMPKGAESKNPFGSSVWERWPGFGRVIDRRGDNAWALEATFRGDRDVREFPAGLFKGGDLPWSAIWDHDEVELLSSASEGTWRK